MGKGASIVQLHHLVVYRLSDILVGKTKGAGSGISTQHVEIRIARNISDMHAFARLEDDRVATQHITL